MVQALTDWERDGVHVEGGGELEVCSGVEE